jgi:hypothetical protein
MIDDLIITALMLYSALIGYVLHLMATDREFNAF